MTHTNSKNTDLIVSSAVSLFKRKGYYNVSVNEICKEAGIGRSSFYAVFPGKREIIIHLLSVHKQNLNSVLQDFMTAKNDFERMWSLCNRYLLLAEDFGPALTKVILSMELYESIGIYDEMNVTNDWLVTLMRNGQAAGIIRCSTPAETMVPIVTDLTIQVIFNWCRCDGSFSLREQARLYAETLYDIDPKYRKT